MKNFIESFITPKLCINLAWLTSWSVYNILLNCCTWKSNGEKVDFRLEVTCSYFKILWATLTYFEVLGSTWSNLLSRTFQLHIYLKLSEVTCPNFVVLCTTSSSVLWCTFVYFKSAFSPLWLHHRYIALHKSWNSNDL